MRYKNNALRPTLVRLTSAFVHCISADSGSFGWNGNWGHGWSSVPDGFDWSNDCNKTGVDGKSVQVENTVCDKACIDAVTDCVDTIAADTAAGWIDPMTDCADTAAGWIDPVTDCADTAAGWIDPVTVDCSNPVTDCTDIVTSWIATAAGSIDTRTLWLAGLILW